MAEENSNVLTNHYDKKKIIQFFVIMVVTAIVWNLPIDTFGIDGLTIVQQRIIAIFVFATLSWLTECIPSWATSLGIITIMCLTVSDNALMPFKGENIGELMDSKHIMASFADPTIMLFLGGFILAAAATKSGLDVLLAHNLIRPFGTKSENVLLGFLLITGIFSMFVSNTATAAMMLTFLTPVFAALPANGKGRIALTMSIPIAANLGGMGTPIGTPPNMIALKFLNDPAGLNMGIDFGHWMAFMFPLVIILLIISWRILLFFFPFSKKTIELEIKAFRPPRMAHECGHRDLHHHHPPVGDSEVGHGYRLLQCGHGADWRLCRHGCHHGQGLAGNQLECDLDGGRWFRPWLRYEW